MAGSIDPLALDNQLCFALYAANRAVTGRYRALLDELGLTYPQYLVMLVLWEAVQQEQVMTVSSLGQRLRLDSGTLTPLLKRLEARGLLQRRRAASDERVVQLALTPEGQAMRQQAQHVPVQLFCDSGLPLGDLVQLREQLKGLLRRLESD